MVAGFEGFCLNRNLWNYSWFGMRELTTPALQNTLVLQICPTPKNRRGVRCAALIFYSRTGIARRNPYERHGRVGNLAGHGELSTSRDYIGCSISGTFVLIFGRYRSRLTLWSARYPSGNGCIMASMPGLSRSLSHLSRCSGKITKGIRFFLL